MKLQTTAIATAAILACVAQAGLHPIDLHDVEQMTPEQKLAIDS
jgi:hypothetical protein